jgi:hypothetical protein
MSKIIAFYKNDAIHPAGYTLEQLWDWSDQDLEYHHDYIQWLFPLPNPSREVSGCPVITAKEIARFRSDDSLRQALRTSMYRMLRFYGLKMTEPEGGRQRIIPAGDFPQKQLIWLTPDNHNYKRLTRILRSLRILGLERESTLLFWALHRLYQAWSINIGTRTLGFWHTAAGAPGRRAP